ncbi:hypothetical protein BLOT_003929 [Blomia tropicalis]|nr:hypothetical protein BLOT_003929 [Blomia tropicalis]
MDLLWDTNALFPTPSTSVNHHHLHSIIVRVGSWLKNRLRAKDVSRCRINVFPTVDVHTAYDTSYTSKLRFTSVRRTSYNMFSIGCNHSNTS